MRAVERQLRLRIVLNAYFRMGHTAGGFRVWWQTLTGSEETLDNTHLMRMAGRFSRRCQADKAGIRFTKEGNCFTQISDAAGFNQDRRYLV